MDVITQTNRTVLFEEVNPEKLDLITLIGDVKEIESLDDEKIKEINEHLLIGSFEEFLDKFEPTIYSYYNAANQKIIYTLERPEGVPADSLSEIRLDQNNDFLKMLFTLIDTKKNQGRRNVDFKFENVLDMISPRKVMEDIKQVRKEIHYLYNKYDELEEEDPKKLKLGDKLNIKFEEASRNYNNVLGMLPLAIEDVKTRLLLGEAGQEEGDADEVQLGMLTMGDEGELKILEISNEEGETLPATTDEKAGEALVEVFQEDYQEITDKPTDYVKDLVVRTFAPIAATKSEVDVEKEIENYNNYLEFYKSSKDDFVKTAKPLVEKLLGVKMFFDQYQTENSGMNPSMLVSNCKVDMLVKTNNKPRLVTYLNTVNGKNNFNDTIWFGILPAVEMDATSNIKTRRERFKGTNKTNQPKGNTLESLTAILAVAKKFKIQIFFNFQASEKTTFNDMATKGMDKYINKTELFVRQEYSEYAIPCLPNFTVIPEDKSGVVLDKKMVKTESGGVILSQERQDILKLWLKGVYIDAAYVAAGIVSAYQCPTYLDENFKKVTNKFPGIRFDIESGDNSLKLPTTLAKEITGFTNKIKNTINRNNFGFVFSSENAQVDGKTINRITVYKARSLAITDDGFDSIYKTLVSTYIERILRFKTSDFKEDKIVKFFSNNPTSQKSVWLNNKGYVNSVLQTGDDISYEIDLETNVCHLDIVFNGNVKNLEVNITKSTSAVS